MEKPVIMLIVIFMATAITATALDNIGNAEFDDELEEELNFDYWNSTAERDISVGNSRAVPDFRAVCNFTNGGQTYWPHPTECNKFVVCAPGGPMGNVNPTEMACAPGVPYWSQSKMTCTRQYTPHGKSPIQGGASCQCGLVNVPKNQVIGRSEEVPTKRIVGGTEVTPTRKYPWQVGIYERRVETQRFACGGSIIGDKWILTAAHCIVEKTYPPNANAPIIGCMVYLPSLPVKVWVGDHDQFSTCDDDSQDTMQYDIKTYIPHGLYDCKNENSPDINVFASYDIALLELTNPIDFNNLIRPICLPTNNMKMNAGDILTLTGWGEIKNDKKSIPSSYLREVQLEARDNKDCGDYMTQPWTLTDLKLCAASQSAGDIGSCKGDSGGPLSVIKNNKHVLVGVVSSGATFRCGDPNYPTIFTRVAHPDIFQWITGHLTKSSCP